MFLQSAYLILCCVSLSSYCYQLKKTLCEGSPCLYLVESLNDSLTWDQSYDACKNESLEVLTIKSKQTQTVVDKLLQDLPQDTIRKVWIGGRRSNDTAWRFMNGTVFNRTVNMTTAQTGLYCLYVTLCKGYNPKYNAVSCDENTSPSRLLCQYDPNESRKCLSSDVLYGNKCYTKTPYNGRVQNKTDWYNGQTYCSQSDIQGDIAYSYLDDDTLINNIIDLVHPGYNCTQLWLGVRTRIWFWKTGSNKTGYNQPIDYYNWDDQTIVTAPPSDCIYIAVDGRNKWLSGVCNDHLEYFICVKDKDGTKTRTSPTTSPTTTSNIKVTTSHKIISPNSDTSINRTDSPMTVLDKPTDNLPGTTSPNNKHSGSGLKSEYIIALVFGLVGIAVIFGLVVFFMLRNRKKPVQQDGYANENLHNLSTKHWDVEEPGYDNVEVSENVKKGDVRYKETPSGELYAMSSKQVNKMDVNKDDKPEVVYAPPKKMKKQKPETSKNSEKSGTANPENDVITQTPSVGEASSGSKHTEDFEAPSGEVYARVIKNENDSDE